MSNNKGFTLVEVIISIAVLSIISVIFLQLFVKAKDIDDSAYYLDRSVMITNSVIEKIKALDRFNDIEESSYFEGFEVQRTENGLEMRSFYDENMEVDIENRSQFLMKVYISELESLANQTQGIYKLDCLVERQDDGTVVYQVDTKVILGP